MSGRGQSIIYYNIHLWFAVFSDIDADYYTANTHKWLSSPKVCIVGGAIYGCGLGINNGDVVLL